MKIDIDKLKRETTGRWNDILSAYGINPGDGSHMPCPICGGKDRFRFDNKDGSGSYICGQCGAGDGWTLIQKTMCTDFIGAAKIIQNVIGECKLDEHKESVSPDARKMIKEIWVRCVNPSGTPVEKYLKSRGIMMIPNTIKYCPKCYNAELGEEIPAMIAAVQNPNGKGVSLHRTYLTDEGRKAEVEKIKMLTPVNGKISGGAIRLFNHGDTLGVAEGIETAVSCMQLFGIPTWAVVSSTIMEGFEPPESARKIVIYADNDASFVGQSSAFILAKKLYQQDRIIEVLMPDNVGDFNDVLNQ